MVGLGRMGGNLARAALERGNEVVGFDPDTSRGTELIADGLERVDSLHWLPVRLRPPRIVLVYVPHGAATEAVCDELLGLLAPGDVLVDGGNSHWEDSRRRHALFAERRVGFVDVGTSGGLWGARNGACFMAGGDHASFERVEPVLRQLAADEEAVLLVGMPGAGHFVKLIHNAIEFGMVEAIAEGMEMLVRSEYRLDLPAVFRNWNHGSVIRSWLVELMQGALEEHPDLDQLSTYVEDTGEVKWVLEWALRRDIPSQVISESQQALMDYRDLNRPMAKAVALLRNAFGGHPLHYTPHG
jgi:6-phosphogluconate dehydrogenase